MKKSTTAAMIDPTAIVDDAWHEIGASFERLCLMAGIATLSARLANSVGGSARASSGSIPGHSAYQQSS